MPRKKNQATVTIEASKMLDLANNPKLAEDVRRQAEYIEVCLREWDAAKKSAKDARETYDEAVDMLIRLCKGDQQPGLFDEVAAELSSEEAGG